MEYLNYGVGAAAFSILYNTVSPFLVPWVPKNFSMILAVNGSDMMSSCVHAFIIGAGGKWFFDMFLGRGDIFDLSRLEQSIIG